MKKKKLFSILEVVKDRIGDVPLKWAVGSSSALLLHGFTVFPEDLDIVTDERGAYILQELLRDYCIEPIEKKKTEKFDSFFGAFEIEGCRVEVMGAFSLRSCIDEKWYCFDSILDHITWIEIDSMQIPIFPLECLADVYAKMGRKKDYLKITLLQATKPFWE